MGRSRYSAGILAYRRREGVLQVFLVHPGGPYWLRRDRGAWSIPKGEHEHGEPALQAARREFREETGLPLPDRLVALTPVRQPGGKLISAWAVEAPGLDPAQLHSNCFALEWPPRSGRQQHFPEVDRAAWFALAEAHVRLTPGQRALLDELADKLVGAGGAAALAGNGDSQ